MERLGTAAKMVVQAGAALVAASQLPPLSLAVIGVAALCGLGMLLYGRWKLQGQEQRHRELMERMRYRHERHMAQLKDRTGRGPSRLS